MGAKEDLFTMIDRILDAPEPVAGGGALQRRRQGVQQFMDRRRLGQPSVGQPIPRNGRQPQR
ncbi:hypothetical protein LCGC14_1905210 [marine sediment metagenome]|uniref:Uncharacterized protein n=1 Tax=marine sediment metagenome TaxID=412755 RepID=A0A0F9ITI3_9ZZZZ